MGDNRNPGKIPPNRRPQRRRRKNDVPPAVIAIYVVMALLILAICAIVFVVTLKNTDDSNASGDGSSLVVSVDSSSGNSSVSVPDSTESSSTDMPDTSSTDSSTSSSESEPTSSSTSSTESGTGESLPVNSTIYTKEYFQNDLFIGDSIFTGLSGYGYMDAANVAAKIGYTPSGAMNKAFDAKGVSAVEYAKSRQPKRIFIMLGSNTMAAGTNYDIIVSQYKDLVKKLREECPKSLICVISIPPVTADSSSAKAGNIKNENIDMVNVKLKAMTAELEEEYFDLNTLLSDNSGYFREDYAEQDGLHFLGTTYKVMLSALQKEMSGANR